MAYDKEDSTSPEYAEQRDDAGFPATGQTPDKMSTGRYLATRLSTLKPPMDKVENPFTLLGSLTSKNWLMFLCAFVAWTWDAFNFFTVSLTVSDLSETFGKSTKAITWGITIVPMFRSVGAIVFGIAADCCGRKWPFVVNNLLFIVLELGTGFCQTHQQFLAWRALFGIAMETDIFIERQRVRAAGHNVGKTFIKEGKVALRRHWLLLIYLVLLMAGFNLISHGSQDLYPIMLTNQYGFSANAVTVTQAVANLGAMAGGTVVGYLRQMFGRRFSIIVISILGGALQYPYGFIGNEKVIAAAFFEQFCVQGAWGVIPIHQMELSPGSSRTFVVGTSYQLGNLVSSASSMIEATIGERFPLPAKHEDGKTIARYKYGIVIAIFIGCVYAYMILLTFLGPEYKGRHLGVSHDADLEEAVGHDAVDAVAFAPGNRRHDSDDDEIEKS